MSTGLILSSAGKPPDGTPWINIGPVRPRRLPHKKEGQGSPALSIQFRECPAGLAPLGIQRRGARVLLRLDSRRTGRVIAHSLADLLGAAGDVFQLVLSVRFSGEGDADPFQVYRALRLLNPSPYMYYCDLGDTQVVGSSPEALVRMNGRQALLRPIAGTKPRGADPAADAALERELLADPKEAAEHVMLVDLARNDLGRVAVPGSIRVEPNDVQAGIGESDPGEIGTAEVSASDGGRTEIGPGEIATRPV